MINKIKQYVGRLSSGRALHIGALLAALITVLVVFGCNVNTVTVHDGETVQRVYSLKSEASELLQLANLKSQSFEVTNVSSSGKNINISLKYTFPVFITVGKETISVTTLKGSSVGEAIENAGIKLDEHDTVNLSLDTALHETRYIDIIDINYVTETTEKRIPYQSSTVYSSKTSSKSVTTKGVEGVKEVTTLTKYVNGEAVSVETLNETVIKEAVNEVITVGTKKPAPSISGGCVSVLTPATPIELDENGNPVNYSKHITVQATAYYDPTHVSATGTYLQPGHVAINTNLYAYGTKFYIKSSDGRYLYGYAVAADTGGFVKTRPTNFDLFFPSEEECRRFGRRNIEVYVLE